MKHKRIVQKQTKAGNRKVIVDGMEFDSKKEFARWVELSAMQERGEISNLERQKKYTLIPPQRGESVEVYKKGDKAGQPKPGPLIEREVAYIADFVYVKDGKTVVEDVKGFRDPSSAMYAKFVLKRKLMLWIHGIHVEEV